MSKMGQEIERKLDENKYELWEALRGLLEWARIGFSDDTGEWADKNDPAIRKAEQALAKMGGI